MSTRTLVMPEIERLRKESKSRVTIHSRTTHVAYEDGYQQALVDVERALLGIGVKVQSVSFPLEEADL